MGKSGLSQTHNSLEGKNEMQRCESNISYRVFAHADADDEQEINHQTGHVVKNVDANSQ